MKEGNSFSMASKDSSTQVNSSDSSARRPPGFFESAYLAVEDRYYSVMDFLDQNLKLPVYSLFVEPIERRGVPSFPVALAGLVLLLACVAAAFSLFYVPNGTVTIVSKAALSGQPVAGASVSVMVGDEFFEAVTDSDGQAVLRSVPLGKVATVQVKADGYKAAARSFEALDAAVPIVLALALSESASVPALRFRVTVVDGDSSPVSGAKITPKFGGVSAASVLTGDDGQADFSLPSTNSFFVAAEKEGYAPASGSFDPSSGLSAVIILSPQESASFAQPEARAAQMTVKTVNSSGAAVAADVTLSSESGAALVRARTIGGSAKVALAQGTKFSYSAVPAGADAGKYLSVSSSEPLSASAGKVITITFAKTPQSAGDRIALLVAGNDNKTLSGAQVNLYLERNGLFAISNRTNSAGAASFDLGSSESYYATVSSSGYLPALVAGLRAPVFGNVTLRKIVPAETGSVEVRVFGVDGSTPISGASVSLRDTSGRYTGYPPVRTGSDGRAVLNNVSASDSFEAWAEYGAWRGKSVSFKPSAASVTKVSVRLQPATATLAVFAGDLSTGTQIAGNAVAYSAGMANQTCSFAQGQSCILTVNVESPVFVEVTATGYERFHSAAIRLEPDDSKEVSAWLVPSALKNEFFVRFTGLAETAGGRAVAAVDKAVAYDAKFVVNIPSVHSGSSGLFVRVGRSQPEYAGASDSNEHFYIRYGSSPSPEHSGTSYSAQASCPVDDAIYESGGAYKWVSFSFDNSTRTREVSVPLFVKPEAADGESVRVSYRGWLGAGNGTFVHYPADSAYGGNWRTTSRDWCYAASNYSDVPVSAGTTVCANGACISLWFSNATGNYSFGGLETVLGRPLFANATVRLTKVLASPNLTVSITGRELSIGAYNAKGDSSPATDGNAAGKYSASFSMANFNSASFGASLTPISPAGSAQFYLSVSDGQKELVRATAGIRVTGTGVMRIELVKPAPPQKLSPFSSGEILVRLTDNSNGNPLKAAQVSLADPEGILEEVPLPILGSGSSGEGLDGRYSFGDLWPLSQGTLTVSASDADYSSASASVSVGPTELFHTSPESRLSDCDGTTKLMVYSDSSKSLSVTVTPSSSGCISAVSIDGIPLSKSGNAYSFTLPAGRTAGLSFTPVAVGVSCTLSVSASQSGSSTTRAIGYSCSSCKQSGAACALPSDCCVADSLACISGRCSACRTAGQSCASASDCCTGSGFTCTDSKCAAVAGAGDNTVTLGLGDDGAALYDASGNEITSLPLGVSSILPSAGFVFKIHSTAKVDRTVKVASDPCYSLLDATGAAVFAPVTVKPDETKYLFVTYPNIGRLGDSAARNCMHYEYSAGKGLGLVVADRALTLGLEYAAQKDITLTLSPKVIDTSGFTMGAAVLDSRGSFVPLSAQADGSLALAPSSNVYGSLGDAAELFVFNNILLENGDSRATVVAYDPTGKYEASAKWSLPYSAWPQGIRAPSETATRHLSYCQTAGGSCTQSTGLYQADAAGLADCEDNLLFYAVPNKGGMCYLSSGDCDAYCRTQSASTAPQGAQPALASISLAGTRSYNTPITSRITMWDSGEGYDRCSGCLTEGSWCANCGTYYGCYDSKASSCLTDSFWTCDASTSCECPTDCTCTFYHSTAGITGANVVSCANSPAPSPSVPSPSPVVSPPAPSVQKSALFFYDGRACAETNGLYWLNATGRDECNSNLDKYQPGHLGNCYSSLARCEANRQVPSFSFSLSARQIRVVPPIGSLADYTGVMVQLDAGKLVMPADKSGSDAFTHSVMQARLAEATQELRNFKLGLSNIPAIARPSGSSDIFSMLGLANQSGALPDLFVTALEGNSTRVLLFESAKSADYDFSYSSPKDITGTYEYPQKPRLGSAGGLYSGRFRGQLPGTYWPNTKLFAYPGQKHATAYYCAAGTDCSNPALTPYAEAGYSDRRTGTPYSLFVLSEGAACTYSGNGCLSSGTDSYCNPVSGKTEQNPLLCCPTGVSRSGRCVGAGASESCVLTASGVGEYLGASGNSFKLAEEMRRAWQANTQGTGTTAESACLSGFSCNSASGSQACSSSNYADAADYLAFNVVNPGAKCFYYEETTTEDWPCCQACDEFSCWCTCRDETVTKPHAACISCHSAISESALIEDTRSGDSWPRSAAAVTLFSSLLPSGYKLYGDGRCCDPTISQSLGSSVVSSVMTTCAVLDKVGSASYRDSFGNGVWSSSAPNNFFDAILFGRQMTSSQSSEPYATLLTEFGVANNADDGAYLTDYYAAVEGKGLYG